ncbi:MAG: dihydroxyacetone kinase subunit DhaL [Spirochaetota bacterium]
MPGKVNAREITENIIASIEQNKAWLSEIDGAIGDGDHGVNMAKGFGMVRKKIDTVQNNISEMFKFVGMTLVSNIGGAMGPIYGTIFMRMGKAVSGKQELEKEEMLTMLQEALAGVKARGKAEAGDKTLVDALEPAVKGYQQAVEQGKSFSEAVDSMIEQARAGMEKTKDMVAKKGRSSRLGERSRGTIDAGAASCYLMLKALGESLKKYV